MKAKNKWGFISGFRRSAENASAQRDSGIYSLQACSTSPTGPTSQTEQQYAPAQRRSKMSNLTEAVKNRPAQRDSEISNLGVLGILRSLGILGEKTKIKNTPAQRDSGISNLTEMVKTGPAQQDSEISILKNSPLCPLCPYCPLDFKTTPAQRDSRMSNLKVKSENSFPQRYSKMSNPGHCPKNPLCPYCLLCLLVFKTSPVQRDSGMSNLKNRPFCPSGLRAGVTEDCKKQLYYRILIGKCSIFQINPLYYAFEYYSGLPEPGHNQNPSGIANRQFRRMSKHKG